MVYCRECFKDVHKAMSNNHKPIEVFQVSSLGQVFFGQNQPYLFFIYVISAR